MIGSDISEIINATTQVYRKGAVVNKRRTAGVSVTEIFDYPATQDAPQGPQYEMVDMVFIDVLVDLEKASKLRGQLEATLAKYPEPDRLAGGPSYIELAPNLGVEQEGALRLMALGSALKMWDIISGKTLGMNDAETRELAGQGMLMISGYGGVRT